MKRALQAASAHAQQPQGHGDGPDVLTQTQICRRLGLSDETWRRWRARGITPPRVALPGHPRWTRADIDAFAQGRRWRNSEPGFLAARRARLSA